MSLIPYEMARTLFVEAAEARRSRESERVALELAAGRVVAKDEFADFPSPTHDKSAMDGYAVDVADFRGMAPHRFVVAAESRTGQKQVLPLEPGTATRIFTGALLPPRANAVIPQENARREGQEVLFDGAPQPFAHVRRKGEDLAPGTLALREGARLGPFQLSLLTSLERTAVEVVRRPRVGIVSTGDELRAPLDCALFDASGEPPEGVAESNGPALRALAERAGAEVVDIWVVPDELELLTQQIERSLHQVDLLVTVGGASVGDHDLVRPALDRLGVDWIVRKVAIKPGKPVCGASLGEKLVLGLPGNPASAQITFVLFGLPMIAALAGETGATSLGMGGKLVRAFRQQPGRRQFLRARLEEGRVEVFDNQASGAATALAWANVLAVVPEEVSELPAGSWIEVIPLWDK